MTLEKLNYVTFFATRHAANLLKGYTSTWKSVLRRSHLYDRIVITTTFI